MLRLQANWQVTAVLTAAFFGGMACVAVQQKLFSPTTAHADTVLALQEPTLKQPELVPPAPGQPVGDSPPENGVVPLFTGPGSHLGIGGAGHFLSGNINSPFPAPIIYVWPDGKKLSGWSSRSGDWDTVELPEGSPIPSISTGMEIAATIVGNKAYGLSGKTGNWSVITIEAPFVDNSGRQALQHSSKVVSFRDQRFVYAMSAEKGEWKKTELRDSKLEPLVQTAYSQVLVFEPTAIHAFGADSGEWATLNVPAPPPIPVGAELPRPVPAGIPVPAGQKLPGE